MSDAAPDFMRRLIDDELARPPRTVVGVYRADDEMRAQRDAERVRRTGRSVRAFSRNLRVAGLRFGVLVLVDMGPRRRRDGLRAQADAAKRGAQ